MDKVGANQLSTVEQMMSDKLCALFSPKRFRRCKDLYDAWHLLTTCEVDKQQLILLLDKKEMYPLPCLQSPFAEDNIDRMEEAYGRLRVTHVEESREIQLPPFDDVQHILNRFWGDITDSEV